MTISRTSHAVLFTKEKCGPCIKTKDFIYDLLENNLALSETLSILKKEHPRALVEAYNLDLYPTLLIVGPNGVELERFVGGSLIRDVIEKQLIQIYRENNA